MQQNMTSDRAFCDAIYVVHDIFAGNDLVTLKHETGKFATCRGTIVDNKCKECKLITPGVLAYSFEMIVRENTDEDSPQLCLRCADSAGESLFGMNASEFTLLSQAEKRTKIEKLLEMPMFSGVMVKYDVDTDDFLKLAYNAEVLPYKYADDVGGGKSMTDADSAM